MHLRDVLSEFVVHHRTEDEDVVSQFTRMDILLEINRIVKLYDVDVNFQSYPIFTDQENGLTHMLDDKFSLQQARGVYLMHHNIIPREYIKMLLDHQIFGPLHPCGYHNRRILMIDKMFKICPTAIVEMTMDQFSYESLDNRECILKEKLGSRTGALKKHAGGKKSIKENLVGIPASDVSLLNGIVGFYQIFDSYLNLKVNLASFFDSFFVQLNPRFHVFETFSNVGI